MNGVNQCTFIGNLGDDPTYNPQFKRLSFRMAATTSYWNGSERKESTEWIPVVVWGGHATALSSLLRKGSQVFVGGKFRTTQWEKDGVKQYTSAIHSDSVILLGGRRD